MWLGRKTLWMGAYCLAVWAFVFLASVRGTHGVSHGTTTGNAAVLANLSLGFVGADSRTQDPLTRVSICADELVLIPTDPSLPLVTRELAGNRGELASGPFVDFGNFTVPPGEYRELRLHIGGCAGQSALVKNPQGVFTTDEGLVLAWRQNIRVKDSHQRVWLPVNSLLHAAEALRSGSEVAEGFRRSSPGARGPSVLRIGHRG